MKKLQVLSRRGGLEFSPATKIKRKENYLIKSGRVRFRAFTFDGKQIIMMLSPAEVVYLARAIENRQTGSLIVHKTENATSSISAEEWERNGKRGYSLVIRRNNDTINVPIPTAEAVYLAVSLPNLAYEVSYEEAERVDEEEREDEPFPFEVEEE